MYSIIEKIVKTLLVMGVANVACQVLFRSIVYGITSVPPWIGPAFIDGIMIPIRLCQTMIVRAIELPIALLEKLILALFQIPLNIAWAVIPGLDTISEAPEINSLLKKKKNE